jgi:hypothetical protein
MKLVERKPSVCKAVIKANGGYFELSHKIFNTFFVYYMIPYVLMSSLFYNV